MSPEEPAVPSEEKDAMELDGEEKRREEDLDVQSTRSVLPQQQDKDTNATEAASNQSSSAGKDETTPGQSGIDAEALSRVESRRPVHSIFTRKQKIFIVTMASAAGFFSPLSANIYFPALNTLASELHVTNELINLTLTSYMIFQGIAPTIFGDLADMSGRRPVYILAFTIYIAANIGLALQNTYAALFILRCLQSTGSSATIALANGVVADVASSSERGTYISWASAGPMIGPTIGPILGGIIAQYLGWQWIFWFLAILAGLYMIVFLLLFPETGRNVVGNGSIPPQRWNYSLISYLQTHRAAKHAQNSEEDALQRTTTYQREAAIALARQRRLRWPNPFKTLRIIGEKDVALILFYNAIVYTAFYDVTASLPYIFQQTYHFNDLQIGLAFIPFGVGCMSATFLNGRIMDWNYRRVAKQAGISIDRKRGEDMRRFPIEKARLQVVFPMLYLGNLMLLGYGWAMDRNAPLAAPLVLTFFIGLFLTGAFNVLSTMLVDLYPQRPSTATAANNLVRCGLGAAGTAVIIQMVNAMGRGWCFTLIALVVFALSPMLWIELKYGGGWREERWVRTHRDKAEAEAREMERSGKGKTL
jgi:multidrug resistance protein